MSGPGALLERRGAARGRRRRGREWDGAEVSRREGMFDGTRTRFPLSVLGADAAQKGNSFFTEAGDSVITAAQRKRVDKNKRFCERGRRKIIQRNGVGLGKIIVGRRPHRDCYMSVDRYILEWPQYRSCRAESAISGHRHSHWPGGRAHIIKRGGEI